MVLGNSFSDRRLQNLAKQRSPELGVHLGPKPSITEAGACSGSRLSELTSSCFVVGKNILQPLTQAVLTWQRVSVLGCLSHSLVASEAPCKDV